MTATQLTVFPPESTAIASPSADQPTLPDGWQWVKLGEVCEKVAKTGLRYQNPETPLQYIDIDAIDNRKYIIVTPKSYTWATAPSRAQQIVKTNDVVFSTVRTYLKNIAQVPQTLNNEIASTGFCVLRAGSRLDHRLLFLYVLSEGFLRPLNEIQRGTSYPAVRNSDIFDQPIPLPPLAEQQRIIAKIDELFSEIDAGIWEVETALQRLKTYRQAVLHHFLSNDKWERVKLGEVADMCLGKMLDKAKNKGTLKPYLRNINVRWGRFDLDDLLLMRFEDSEGERYGVQTGDLIVCEGGEPGRAAIWKGETQEAKIQKALHRVRFRNTVQVEFFYYFLLISSYDGYLSKFFTGTTIKHLTSKEFAKFRFPLPDLDTQTCVVQEIEARLSEADALEKTLRTELLRAERLRQSVLKQAFTGKLVQP